MFSKKNKTSIGPVVYTVLNGLALCGGVVANYPKKHSAVNSQSISAKVIKKKKSLGWKTKIRLLSVAYVKKLAIRLKIVQMIQTSKQHALLLKR